MKAVHRSGLTAWLTRRGIASSSFLVSSGIVVAFILLAILSPLLIGGDPFANHFDPQGGVARYQLPSTAYFFGTNVYGQDVFEQTMLGARRTLIIGLVSGAIIMVVSTLIGMVSGYFAGATDAILMRVTDFFYAIPFLPFTLVFVHFFGAGIESVCAAIGLVFWRTGARVVRSAVLSLRERQYVKAAKTSGAGPVWIMRYHILPGIFGISLLYGVFGVAWAILTEATLSFIGLSDPTSISWGLMLNQAFANGAIRFAWWWVIPPGVSLTLLLGALFLLARSIEGAVDPRLAEV
jgi:peptide/nickel transport system permease protein